MYFANCRSNADECNDFERRDINIQVFPYIVFVKNNP